MTIPTAPRKAATVTEDQTVLTHANAEAKEKEIEEGIQVLIGPRHRYSQSLLAPPRRLLNRSMQVTIQTVSVDHRLYFTMNRSWTTSLSNDSFRAMASCLPR